MTNEDMTIDFKGRHDQISERMREHAARKLARLGRYNDRIARVEVVADHAHQMPEVELIVHMRRGKPLIAKERSTTFANAIDLLVEKMERQLKRQKEKRKDHKPGRKASAAGRPRLRGDAPAEETYEEVVRRTLRG